jgi:hypothetical protein
MDKVSFSMQSGNSINKSTVNFVIGIPNGNGGNGNGGAVVCPNNPRLAKMYNEAQKAGATEIARIIRKTCHRLDNVGKSVRR